MSQTGSPQATTNSESSTPEPTNAERARTLMDISRFATLCTTSQKHPDWPFGSLVAYGMGYQGNPSVLISNMAMHTKNLLADPRVSLLVTPSDKGSDPLGTARVTVMGEMKRIPKEESADIRREYLARHGHAAYWVDFADFHFYMMDIIDIYYVGGFGVMGWVTASDYHAARVDPLAYAQNRLIDHINTQYAEAVLMMGRTWGKPNTEHAVLTAIDRLGFHLRLKTPERVTSSRLAFPKPIESPDDVQSTFLAMIQLTEKVLHP